MRTLYIVVLLFAAAAAQAAVDTTSTSSGPVCASDGAGQTCSHTTSTRRSVDLEGQAGATVVEERRWSWGHHTDNTPNTWNSSRRSYGAGAYALGHTADAQVGLREYSASEDSGGHTRRTTDNGVELTAAASDLPTPLPALSFTDRRVEGGYHHCIVTIGHRVLVEVACGPEALEESPPLP